MDIKERLRFGKVRLIVGCGHVVVKCRLNFPFLLNFCYCMKVMYAKKMNKANFFMKSSEMHGLLTRWDSGKTMNLGD